MSGRLDGRVAVVTGAGRGLGRAHALTLAREGAAVVVNDVGGSADADDRSPAHDVVEEITKAGGSAVASIADVSDWAAAEQLVATATSQFGDLNILVNNAGLLRDRTIVNMTPQEWDLVIGVHLRGSFATLHFAAAHWRGLSKSGAPVYGRAINTTSVAGLFYYPGQANYGAAKAGIAALTGIAAKELQRYGVTVNAISPAALTRMTEGLQSTSAWTSEEHGPEQVAELVAWLASDEAADVTGQVFGVGIGEVYLTEPWRKGRTARQQGGFSVGELGPVVRDILSPADDA
jgi:NAD(P)-dependent dehydrogenase (short-subunit alcohol dehydrogenase family)